MFVLWGVPVPSPIPDPPPFHGVQTECGFILECPSHPGLSQSHLIPVSPCPCPHIPPGGIPPWIPLGGPNPIPSFPPGSILHAGFRLHPRYPHRERGFCGRCRLPPRQDVPGDHCGNREWDGQRRGGRGGLFPPPSRRSRYLRWVRVHPGCRPGGTGWSWGAGSAPGTGTGSGGGTGAVSPGAAPGGLSREGYPGGGPYQDTRAGLGGLGGRFLDQRLELPQERPAGTEISSGALPVPPSRCPIPELPRFHPRSHPLLFSSSWTFFRSSWFRAEHAAALPGQRQGQ